MNIQLFIIYIITLIEFILTGITYKRININYNNLLIKNQSKLDLIIYEYNNVVSTLFCILLLTIPIYIDNIFGIYFYILIYFLILLVYFKLEWINKKLNNE